MKELKDISREEKYKIAIMSFFLVVSCVLTFYFHGILAKGTFFSHVFYIPIILAALWWKRKGLWVAVFLSTVLLMSRAYIRHDVVGTDDYFRALMFVIIAIVADTLSGYIERAEGALRDSEERYRTTFEHTGTAMSIVDEDNTLVLVNKMYEKLSGYAKEDVEGRKSWTEFVAPEDVERLIKYHKDRRKEGGSAPNVFEYTFINRYGEKRNVLVNSELIPGTKRTIASLLDNTEFKRTREALRESEEKYRTIFENTGTSTIIIEEDTTLSLVNSEFEKLSGYKKYQIEGKKSWTEFVVEEDLPKMKMYHKLRRSGAVNVPRNYEFRFIDKERNMKDIYITIALIPGTVKSLASMMDLTEYKKAEKLAKLREKQLVQADKMATIGILSTGVAHEINNPNNFILLNGKMLSKVWRDVTPILNRYYEDNGDFVLAGMPYSGTREKIEPLINGITGGAKRIQKIIESLKNFARQDRGNLNQPVEVNSVVKSSILIVNNLIKKSTNKFSVKYGADLPTLTGNAQQLEQVVINLITNSCQALEGKDKRIEILTDYNQLTDSIIITVKDEGAGIAPENLKHIFDPFFTTKRDIEGTGLGLSITYNIIKDHGGDLKLTSDEEKGTTAVVAIPVKPKNGETMKEKE